MFSYKEIFNISELFNVKMGAAAFLASGVGGFLTWLYGGTTYNLLCMTALTLVIAFDWTSGSVASKKDGSYASVYGLQGLARTMVMLLLPVFGVLMDQIFSMPNLIFLMFWGGLMYHTLISMTANFTRAGWDKYIPNWAIDYVSSEIESKIKRANTRVVIPEKNKDESIK